MLKITEEPEINRIVIAVSGDELSLLLSSIIPEEVYELIEPGSDAEKVLNHFEKGIFKFCLQIEKTQVEGF